MSISSFAAGAALVFLSMAAPVLAQPGVVAGRVTDADTGESLPGATVQLDGTFVGTVTNAEGRYALDLGGRTGVLVVRYIGYDTQRVQPGGPALDVALQPAALLLGEVVVSGEDPAVQLMRRVIEQKKAWRESLRSWRADAYVRYVVLAEDEIAAIKEVATEAFWDRERGLAERATAARTTDNLAATPGPLAAAAALVNLYDDEIDFAGFALPGVTGPDALRFYRFAITGQRVQDGVPVYDVSVRPKSDLQPGFEGTLAVLDRPAALLRADLSLSRAVRLPLIQDLDARYSQAFSAFGQGDGGAFLPVDFRFDASATPGMTGLRFPKSGFRISASLSGYEAQRPRPGLALRRRRARRSRRRPHRLARAHARGRGRAPRRRHPAPARRGNGLRRTRLHRPRRRAFPADGAARAFHRHERQRREHVRRKGQAPPVSLSSRGLVQPRRGGASRRARAPRKGRRAVRASQRSVPDGTRRRGRRNGRRMARRRVERRGRLPPRRGPPVRLRDLGPPPAERRRAASASPTTSTTTSAGAPSPARPFSTGPRTTACRSACGWIATGGGPRFARVYVGVRPARRVTERSAASAQPLDSAGAAAKRRRCGWAWAISRAGPGRCSARWRRCAARRWRWSSRPAATSRLPVSKAAPPTPCRRSSRAASCR